jgi:hypothetical protein
MAEIESRLASLEAKRKIRPRHEDDEEPPRRRGDAEARIAKLVGQRNQLRAELDERDSLIADLRIVSKGEIDATKEAAAKSVLELRAEYDHRSELSDLGVKSDTSRAALEAWRNSLPESKRPKKAADLWRAHLDEVKTAREKKADLPETPAELRHLLPAEQTEEKTADKPAAKTRARNPDTGAKSSGISREEELERRVEAAKTTKEANEAYRWFNSGT